MSTSSEPQRHDALLLTLEEISQLVSHSRDAGDTLANIVHLIQARFGTDVCSVYLLEHDRGELMLAATVGLVPAAIGSVRMRLDEGLTGLVAQQKRPVMVEDATRHPRFKYFPQAGEDPYHSFLGVPLVERGVVQGVLVLQTVQPRPFSSDETRMLSGVACQLAPLISGAGVLQRVLAAAAGAVAPAAARPQLRGLPLSAGTGAGEAWLMDTDFHGARPCRPTGTPRAELRRFRRAVEAACAELVQLDQRLSALVGEECGAILHAQLMMLRDQAIERDVAAGILAGASAEASLQQTLGRYAAAFERLASPFFRERLYDVKDVARRMLWHLRPAAARRGPAAERVVMVSREASVMELFTVDLDRLAGIVVEHGGPHSHAAILARSLGVPMVGGVRFPQGELAPGQLLLVDGTGGAVHVDPPAAAVRAACDPAPRARASAAAAAPLAAGLPELLANINLLGEVPAAIAAGATGVGLYRSELVFLARRTLPTEEEQVALYAKLLGLLGGRPVSIRTFDLRPDKVHPQLEAAEALDWRRVLASPPMQQVFREQIRAILRSAAFGPARILVPLVLRSEQLDFVHETIARARAELRSEGHDLPGPVPLGAMIEAPAATALIELWAPRVDWFAVGTNDLVAAALGLERQDATLYDPLDQLHPGVLRTLHHVVEAAHAAGRPVCVCGEMAGDPRGALALAALGVDALSIAAHRLPSAREALAAHAPADLRALTPELLRAPTARAAAQCLP